MEEGLPAIPPFKDECDILLPSEFECNQSKPFFVDVGPEIIAKVQACNIIRAARKTNPSKPEMPNCLYFIGYILYRDDIGVGRRTAFCRLYNFQTKRFEIVKDPDYEYN